MQPLPRHHHHQQQHFAYASHQPASSHSGSLSWTECPYGAENTTRKPGKRFSPRGLLEVEYSNIAPPGETSRSSSTAAAEMLMRYEGGLCSH